MFFNVCFCCKLSINNSCDRFPKSGADNTVFDSLSEEHCELRVVERRGELIGTRSECEFGREILLSSCGRVLHLSPVHLLLHSASLLVSLRAPRVVAAERRDIAASTAAR